MRSSNGNEATRRLGIAHPIVQGPFGGGLSSTRLASIVSNLGGLGSYGAHLLSGDQIDALVAEMRGLTTQPFAVNLWLSDHDAGGLDLDDASFERWWPLFEPWFRELGVDKPERLERGHPSPDEQIEALLAARPPVFSFVFGVPSRAVLAECRRCGIITMGVATTIAEAEALDAAGVDLIVASGIDAGGHRPSFLAPAERSLIGTFALVQLVSPRVRAPVVAAGGIADQRGMRAAFALGAQAVQIGTAFLACDESGTTELHRAALFGEAARDTALTRAFSGRLARGIRNRWVDAMDGTALPPFPITGWFVSRLRPAALAAGRTDLVSLWSGQIAPNLRHRSATALMQSLLSDLPVRSFQSPPEHALS